MKRPTLARVRGCVARANGLDSRQVSAAWVSRPRLVPGAEPGYQFFTATARISAPGFRTREMVVTSADDLLHAMTYGTKPGDATKGRMRELERELARLKGEGAPATDPRVKAALGEYARLLTGEALGKRVAAAMGKKS